jgi:hypothetical protein
MPDDPPTPESAGLGTLSPEATPSAELGGLFSTAPNDGDSQSTGIDRLNNREKGRTWKKTSQS